MSIEMPPELAWVANLAVGQSWPQGDEDNLRALGAAWEDAAQELRGISEHIGSSANGVLESVGGQVGDEFRDFIVQLEGSLPAMSESAKGLGTLGRNTGLQLEYAKYMILLQLILLAAQIAHWAFFAPELIPAAITSARVAIQMILRRLLISIAIGVGLNVGMDVAVQTLQMLKGDRTQWSIENTVSAAGSGAIGGAVGGIFFGVGSVLAPKFANSLPGKGILGVATGITTTGVMQGIYGGEEAFGSSITSGALSALEGGGKWRFGRGGPTEVDPVPDLSAVPEFDVPDVTSADGLPASDPPDAEPTFSNQAENQGGNQAENQAGSTGGPEGDIRVTGPEQTLAVREATGGTPSSVGPGVDGGLAGFTNTLAGTSHQTTGTPSRASTAPSSSTATGATTTDRAGGTPAPASRVTTSTSTATVPSASGSVTAGTVPTEATR
ncbi:hypothetical protein HRW07_30300, partial [Streptomyces lunaelactis]|nr:hypothetical protein [Streptomyces lunaelactis]